ncbi:ATP-binding protein [Candidatus Bipolaricaulota bacterium]
MSDPPENKQTIEPQEDDEYIATTIPVRIDIDMKQAVLGLDEAEEILRSARSIALGPCTCRKTEQNCDAPVDVCLSLNHSADGDSEWEGFETVTVARALETLRTSHEAGLVHLAYRKPGKEITEFCSCCSCCCWFLNRLKATDYHESIVEAKVIAEQDEEKCLGCGTCVQRCPFDAWQPSEDGEKPSLKTTGCFGCGVCVTACPADAISLVPRSAATRFV